MKTRITLLFVLLLALVCTAASAQEYYTLPEIREQAAAGWHETYTDKYGREMAVDIDVEVFGEDVAPVLKVGFHEYGEYITEHNHPSEAYEKQGGEPVTIYDLHLMKVDLDRGYGEEYGNDLTLREAYTILAGILNNAGIPSEGFLFEQPEKLQLTYKVKKKTGEITVPAHYSIRLWSEQYGLPIFTHVNNTHNKSGSPYYVPYLSLVIRSRDEYALCDRSFQVQDVIAEDIPLCSVDRVIESVGKRIKTGHIQKVYSLRFGYSVYNDPTVPSNKRMSAFDAKCYYLVPSWVLSCEFMANPKENYNEYEGKRTLTINAQTGEMIDPFDASVKGVGNAGYKGFIPWDKVQ